MVKHIFLILSIRDAARRLQVLIDHADVEVEKLWTRIKSLVAHDKGTQELCGSLLYPLGRVCCELLENLEQGSVLNFIRGKDAHFRENLNGLAPDSPYVICTELFENGQEDALVYFWLYRL